MKLNCPKCSADRLENKVEGNSLDIEQKEITGKKKKGKDLDNQYLSIRTFWKREHKKIQVKK